MSLPFIQHITNQIPILCAFMISYCSLVIFIYMKLIAHVHKSERERAFSTHYIGSPR